MIQPVRGDQKPTPSDKTLSAVMKRAQYVRYKTPRTHYRKAKHPVLSFHIQDRHGYHYHHKTGPYFRSLFTVDLEPWFLLGAAQQEYEVGRGWYRLHSGYPMPQFVVVCAGSAKSVYRMVR